METIVIVNFLLKLVIISAATSAASLTITRSTLLAWFRAGLKRKKATFLLELFSCPYCVSHWVALALVWAFPLRLSEGNAVMDVIMLTFVVVAFASVISGKVYAAIASIGDQDTPTEIEGDER